MNSTVYKKKPRKPFSKRRIWTFTGLQHYSRVFKVQPKKLEGLKIIIIGSLLIFIVFQLLFKLNTYNETRREQQVASKHYKNTNAFNFLIDSGMERLRAGYYNEAYYEFKLAYKIDPEDEKLKSMIIETISVLCIKDLDYCDDLNLYLE